MRNTKGGKKGTIKRIGFACSGASHIALAVVPFQMLTRTAGGDAKQTYLGELMSQPGGQFVVGALGAALIAVGLVQLIKAKTTEFRKELMLQQMSQRARTIAIASGRIGLAARGVVFPLMGFFLMRAAITQNPAEAKGLGGALQELAAGALGTTMLAVVATGLFFYGIYQFVQARYRRIPAG